MHIPSFSFLGHLDDTFAGGWFAGRPAGRPAKPEINANLSPAWLAGAWAELGNINPGILAILRCLPLNFLIRDFHLSLKT